MYILQVCHYEVNEPNQIWLPAQIRKKRGAVGWKTFASVNKPSPEARCGVKKSIAYSIKSSLHQKFAYRKYIHTNMYNVCAYRSISALRDGWSMPPPQVNYKRGICAHRIYKNPQGILQEFRSIFHHYNPVLYIHIDLKEIDTEHCAWWTRTFAITVYSVHC